VILLLLFTEWGKAAHLVLTNAPLRSNEHDALRPAFLTHKELWKTKIFRWARWLAHAFSFLKVALV